MTVSKRIQQEDAILNQIRTTLRGMETFLDFDKPRKKLNQKVAYASHAITTGKRLYQTFEKYKVTSVEELHRINASLYKEQVMNPNIQEGIAFGRTVRKMGYGSVIVPGVYFAEGWTQEHYMSMWKRVILEYADTVHFYKYWYLGAGCAKEFLIGLGSKKVLREQGQRQPLTQKDGAQKIRRAIEYIDKIGANPLELYNVYREIILYRPDRIIIDLGKKN